MTKIALVTGGTRGIGATISISLKNAGYNVAATYNSNTEKASKPSRKILKSRIEISMFFSLVFN